MDFIYLDVIFTVYCEDPPMLNHDSARSLAWRDCIGDRGSLWACTATEKTGSEPDPRTVSTGSRCATQLRQSDRKGRQSAYDCNPIQVSRCVEVQPIHADSLGGEGVGEIGGDFL